jgi:hypothetical protein
MHLLNFQSTLTCIKADILGVVLMSRLDKLQPRRRSWLAHASPVQHVGQDAHGREGRGGLEYEQCSSRLMTGSGPRGLVVGDDWC